MPRRADGTCSYGSILCPEAVRLYGLHKDVFFHEKSLRCPAPPAASAPVFIQTLCAAGLANVVLITSVVLICFVNALYTKTTFLFCFCFC